MHNEEANKTPLEDRNNARIVAASVHLWSALLDISEVSDRSTHGLTKQ